MFNKIQQLLKPSEPPVKSGNEPRLRHDINALSTVVQQFFSAHLMFTDADLRQHCQDNYGLYTEDEYRQAMRISTNIFKEVRNV
jgi:hypothetical protein